MISNGTALPTGIATGPATSVRLTYGPVRQ